VFDKVTPEDDPLRVKTYSEFYLIIKRMLGQLCPFYFVFVVLTEPSLPFYRDLRFLQW
jgi:hypothetical protein